MEKNKEKEQISAQEFETKVLELAKSGLTAEKIGLKLKEQKIHTKNYEKKISQILKEHNLYQSPDLINVQKKLNKVSNHFEKNKQDKRALREKSRIFSQLRKIKLYLKIPTR